MTFVLPLVALALAVLSRFASRDQERRSWRVDSGRLVALVLLTAVAAGIVARYGVVADRAAMETGLVLGALAAVLGELFGGTVAPWAVGVAAASALHGFGGAAAASAQLALMGGAALGAVAFGADGALCAAVAAALVAAGDNLGARHSEAAGAAFLGSEVGLAVAVGAFVAGYLPPRIRVLQPLLVGVFAAGAGFFAAKTLGDGGLSVAAGIGAAAGAVIHWLLPDEEADAVRLGLAAIIGIGVATLAFAFGKGAGMALSLVAAGGVLLGLGNRRAFLTLGPLAGLVFYRVLREAGTGATRALDIAQHYTLLTLALGAVVPLLPADWLRRSHRFAAFGAFLWGVLILASPPLVIVMFGMRGAIGFVVGLGLSGLCQALRRESGILPLSLAGGMSAATILALDWLGDKAELSRDEKVHFFLIAGTAIVVVAVLLAVVSRPAKKEAVS